MQGISLLLVSLPAPYYCRESSIGVFQRYALVRWRPRSSCIVHMALLVQLSFGMAFGYISEIIEFYEEKQALL